MPTMAFDEQCVPEGATTMDLKTTGDTVLIAFCSASGLFCNPPSGSQIQEFRDMVKALHKAGIGIIMDVAFNHTAEGGGEGPTINFKGFGNSGFYHLDPHDRSIYRDFTGCGNTVNCNHPVISRFIVDCLEYWVREMHVLTGFDLTWQAFSPVTWMGRQNALPPHHGLSSFPIPSPAQNLSPRPGMLQGSTRWAGSRVTDGPSGMACTAT